MSDTMHDLVDLYALDALEPDEQRRFEGHLESCEDCRARLADLRSVTDSLGGAEWETPPAHVKDRVMASLDDAKAAGAGRSRVIRLLSAAAIAAVVVVAIVGVLALAGPSVDDVLGASDRVEVALTGEVPGSVRLVYSAREEAGVVLAAGIDGAPVGQTYQAWLISDGEPASAGLFAADSGEVLLEGNPATADAIGITLEPEGGSPQPTGDILFVASLET